MLRRVLLKLPSRSSPRPSLSIFSFSRSLSSSPWSSVPQAPPDPIIGLNDAFRRDPSPDKINVGVGAYRGDDGLPHVLPCVREAETLILGGRGVGGTDHEYAAITGEAAFLDRALAFAYGEEAAGGTRDRIAATQTLSGTGGLRVFGEYLKRFGAHGHIYVPDPTWGNHIPIMGDAGLEVRKYRYYDRETNGLDFAGALEDLRAAPEGSCILLHACAHNPTGMDPSPDQWAELSALIKSKNHLPFFDSAYQGFASGDAPTDAAALRSFLADGHPGLALVQSFSKNFGLYGQRVGALSIVAGSPEEAKAVESQVKKIIRPMYSNPPRHGARIVATVLSDPGRTADFIAQCKAMAERIGQMRVALRDGIGGAGSTRNWDHITDQIGMFAYSGMTKEEVELLRDRHHIYCTLDGRISMAGVTSGNVNYMANAIHDVTK